MRHLASLNIVHKDLAARNCLLSKDLSLVVSDFGLARLANEEKVIYSKSNVGPLKVRKKKSATNVNKFSAKTVDGS